MTRGMTRVVNLDEEGEGVGGEEDVGDGEGVGGEEGPLLGRRLRRKDGRGDGLGDGVGQTKRRIFHHTME